MEIIFTILQQTELNCLQVLLTGLVLFGFGYRLGTHKSRELHRKMGKLEREFLDVNAKLLSSEGRERPQAEIRESLPVSREKLQAVS